jgi:hypothetical protein
MTPSTDSEQRSLKQRIGSFWSWFSYNAERYTQCLCDGEYEGVHAEVAAAIEELLPTLAWSIDPSPTGLVFTLSGEGNSYRQFITCEWLRRAPQIPGWTFSAARQPAVRIRDIKLQYSAGEDVFRPREFWVSPHTDVEQRRIHLTAWHPQAERLSAKIRSMGLMLMLDEVLGEFGTEGYIGSITFSDKELKQALPITELREHCAAVAAQEKWSLTAPTERYIPYHLSSEEPREQAIRADILHGQSRCTRLVKEWMQHKGPIPHPLPSLGIDMVCVMIPAAHFPEEQRDAWSDEIARLMQEQLMSEHAGLHLGTAVGGLYVYVDFILHDSAQGHQILRHVLQELCLPADSCILPMTQPL